MIGNRIEVSAADGAKVPAYLAAPAGNGKTPGVVLIQEWWGINAQIEGVAERLAQAGFRTLAPDLYRGKIATSADEAGRMMQSLDWGAAVSRDIRSGVDHLKQSGGKVAVMGFCMGGALTLLSAMQLSNLDGGICFYGIPPEPAGDPRKIRIPLQLHFAQHDDWCTPMAVDALERKLRDGGVPFELHRYDAHHAFFNEQRPEVYSPDSARLAWDRSLAFLKKTLS